MIVSFFMLFLQNGEKSITFAADIKINTMRKLILLFALIMAASHISAQNFELFKEMQSKGLPSNAIPAKFYFANQFDNPTKQSFNSNDMYGSVITTPYETETTEERQQYFFVVEQAISSDQDFPYLDIWVCADDGKPYRAFHQTKNNYGDQMLLDIYVMSDVTTRDSTYTDKKTKQRITRHLKNGAPVAAFNVQEYTGTAHGIVSTLLLQCESGETQLLKSQKPVAILTPLSNMLMIPEWNLPQNYLITTSTGVFSSDPYESTDDFSIFSKIQFTPELHIYTPKGKLLNSFELPTDDIDMLR